MVTIKKHLMSAAGALALAILAAAVPVRAAVPVTQDLAHPSVNQKFSVTSQNWNQLYLYDYNTAVGSMGNLNAGSTTVPYKLTSSYNVASAYGNYTGIFIYDYSAAAWVEVFYAADGTDYVY